MQQPNGKMSFRFAYDDQDWKNYCNWSKDTSPKRPLFVLDQERELVREFNKLWAKIHPEIIINTENGVIYDGREVKKR